MNHKIPYALDKEGRLVSALEATKGEAYICAGCNEKLIFKFGDIRERHFAHSIEHLCSPETLNHILAKRLICEVVDKNYHDEQSIYLECICNDCGDKFEKEIPSKTFITAKEEVRVENFTCDVVAYQKNETVLAIEIFHTHKVDNKKSEDLTVHWIELNSLDVISNPWIWKPFNSRLKPVVCMKCKKKIENIRNLAYRWKINPEIFADKGIENYKAAPHICFKCKHEILVFWWRGVPFTENKPPQPMPHTIQYRYSKMFGGSYYMNTCPNCMVSQGDNFVFLNADSPFRNLPMSNDTSSEVAIVEVNQKNLKSIGYKMTGGNDFYNR